MKGNAPKNAALNIHLLYKKNFSIKQLYEIFSLRYSSITLSTLRQYVHTSHKPKKEHTVTIKEVAVKWKLFWL